MKFTIKNIFCLLVCVFANCGTSSYPIRNAGECDHERFISLLENEPTFAEIADRGKVDTWLNLLTSYSSHAEHEQIKQNIEYIRDNILTHMLPLSDKRLVSFIREGALTALKIKIQTEGLKSDIYMLGGPNMRSPYILTKTYGAGEAKLSVINLEELNTYLNLYTEQTINYLRDFQLSTPAQSTQGTNRPSLIAKDATVFASSHDLEEHIEKKITALSEDLKKNITALSEHLEARMEAIETPLEDKTSDQHTHQPPQTEKMHFTSRQAIERSRQPAEVEIVNHLEERMDNMASDIQKDLEQYLKSQIDELENKIKDQSTDQGPQTEKMNSLSGQMNALEQKMNALEDKFEDTHHKDLLQKIEKISQIEERIGKIEDKNTEEKELLHQTKEILNTVNERIDLMKKGTDQIKEDINFMDEEITKDIQTIGEDIKNITLYLNGLHEQVIPEVMQAINRPGLIDSLNWIHDVRQGANGLFDSTAQIAHSVTNFMGLTDPQDQSPELLEVSDGGVEHSASSASNQPNTSGKDTGSLGDDDLSRVEP